MSDENAKKTTLLLTVPKDMDAIDYATRVETLLVTTKKLDVPNYTLGFPTENSILITFQVPQSAESLKIKDSVRQIIDSSISPDSPYHSR